MAPSSVSGVSVLQLRLSINRSQSDFKGAETAQVARNRTQVGSAIIYAPILTLSVDLLVA
jgi:hypothetical protein